MKIPTLTMPRAVKRIGILASIALMMSALVYGSVSLTTPGTANVHGPTSGVLTAVSLNFFNGTSVACTVSPNQKTSTCPVAELTLGGSSTESGNFTIASTFIANSAGTLFNIGCSTTGSTATVTCTPNTTSIIATGAAQTVTAEVDPSTTATITYSLITSG